MPSGVISLEKWTRRSAGENLTFRFTFWFMVACTRKSLWVVRLERCIYRPLTRVILTGPDHYFLGFQRPGPVRFSVAVFQMLIAPTACAADSFMSIRLAFDVRLSSGTDEVRLVFMFMLFLIMQMSVALLSAPESSKTVEWYKSTPYCLETGMLVLARVSVHKTIHGIPKVKKGAWRKTHDFAHFIAEEIVVFESVS